MEQLKERAEGTLPSASKQWQQWTIPLKEQELNFMQRKKIRQIQTSGCHGFMTGTKSGSSSIWKFEFNFTMETNFRGSCLSAFVSHVLPLTPEIWRETQWIKSRSDKTNFFPP